MRTHKLDRVLSIDTEWTCWEGEPPPGMQPEIIEIGIVESDVREGTVLRRGSWLVRPAASRVGDYCEQLTGITDEEVRRSGRPLGEVLRSLAKEFGPARKPTIAWGDDWSGIERECRRLGLDNPFPRELAVNFGLVYALATGSSERPALSFAIEREGVVLEERLHRARPDAEAALLVFLSFSARSRPAPSAEGPTP